VGFAGQVTCSDSLIGKQKAWRSSDGLRQAGPGRTGVTLPGARSPAVGPVRHARKGWIAAQGLTELLSQMHPAEGTAGREVPAGRELLTLTPSAPDRLGVGQRLSKGIYLGRGPPACTTTPGRFQYVDRIHLPRAQWSSARRNLGRRALGEEGRSSPEPAPRPDRPSSGKARPARGIGPPDAGRRRSSDDRAEDWRRAAR